MRSNAGVGAQYQLQSALKNEKNQLSYKQI
jgi:hypothetical protein